jgi:hypothetical protein
MTIKDIAITQDYGVEVCEILGIDPHHIASVSIVFDPGGVVNAEIRSSLDNEQVKRIIKIARSASNSDQ